MVRFGIGISALLSGAILALTRPELALPTLPIWMLIICSLVLWNDRATLTRHNQLRKEIDRAPQGPHQQS